MKSRRETARELLLVKEDAPMTDGKLLKAWLEVQRAHALLQGDLLMAARAINDGAAYERIELGLLACQLSAAVFLEKLIQVHLTAVELQLAGEEK